MFGLPGAVVFYAVAGRPDRPARHRLGDGPAGKGRPAGDGAVLRRHGRPPGLARAGLRGRARPMPAATSGTLTAMVPQMSQVSQPSLFSSWLRSFGSFQAGHGWSVNLVVVRAPRRRRRLLPQRQPPPGAHRGRGRRRALPGRLGPRPGPRILRRRGHRPQLDDPDGPRVHRRVPGRGPGAGPGRVDDSGRCTRCRRRPDGGCARRAPRRPGFLDRLSPSYLVRSLAGPRRRRASCWSVRPRWPWPPPTPTPIPSSTEAEQRDPQRRRPPGGAVHPHRPARPPGLAGLAARVTRWCSPSSTRCARRTAP